MSPQTRGEIRDLLDQHGLHPTQRLGQHFLADANITRKIVSLAGVGPDDEVLEVGAGTGTLTRALALTGARVVSYEVDARLKPVLEEVTAGLDVDLRLEDVMKVDLARVVSDGDWTMVANLPYNIGTPLVLEILQRVPAIVHFVVMVQKEVALRLVAQPGSADYGLPSVITRLHCLPELAFTVAPQVFYPAPQVDSAVIVLARTQPDPAAGRAIQIAAAAFGQRRKMVRRSLAEEFPDVNQALDAAGIDPTARAENLSPDDFLRLGSG